MKSTLLQMSLISPDLNPKIGTHVKVDKVTVIKKIFILTRNFLQAMKNYANSTN